MRLRLALRLLLGLVLLATAAGKLLDVRGFAQILATYEAFPESMLGFLAVMVPLLELVVAGWLFSGRRLSGAAAGALTLHLVYAVWAAATLARGLRLPNCGCFGVFLPRPLGWRTVAEDLVLAGLSAWLLRIALARRKS